MCCSCFYLKGQFTPKSKLRIFPLYLSCCWYIWIVLFWLATKYKLHFTNSTEVSFHRSCSRSSAEAVSSFMCELLCFYCATPTTRITAQRQRLLVFTSRIVMRFLSVHVDTSDIWMDETARKLRGTFDFSVKCSHHQIIGILHDQFINTVKD